MYQTKKQKGVITDKTILIKKKKTIKKHFNITKGIAKKKNKKGRNDPSKPEYACPASNPCMRP